jgi:predicted transcriptional regulator
MSSDDTSDERRDETGGENADSEAVRNRLEEEADRAVEQFDEGLVDVLSWVLETETRARIYVYLRQNPHSTSDEIAEGTGLYPSTVREALAELHDEGRVSRTKRESDGAGNNPYEYAAMAPSDLVGSIVDDVQDELNRVCNLDQMLGPDRGDDFETGEEPVTITVEDAGSNGETDEDADGTGDADGDGAGGT